jgi:uracil-DNA glycosylase
MGGQQVTRSRTRSTATTKTAATRPPVRTPREHIRAVEGCTACSLHTERTTPVVGDGPVDARLVVVAAVPRRHEDLQGRALAGAGRNVLDTALVGAGLVPAEVRVTSVLRCRPLGDREPTSEEVRACTGHLREELAMLAPEVVVSLGAFATSVLLGRSVPLERVAGYRLDILQGVTLVPTYHPRDAVRGVPQAASALRRDLAVARAVLEGRMKTGAEALADMRSRLVADG